MVKLRLKRIGKKQFPFYRIVAADSRVNRNGKYIELIGTFDPLKNEVKLDQELALKWLNHGAQPTDTVRDIFSKQGVMAALHEQRVAALTANAKKKAVVEAKEAPTKPSVKKTPTKKPAVKKEAAPVVEEK